MTTGMAQLDVVQLLRDAGLNKIDSMLALSDIYGIYLEESKRIVHCSDAWQDRKAADERFHEDLLRAVDSLSSVPRRQRIAG